MTTTTKALDLDRWTTAALERAAKLDEPAWAIAQRRAATGHARALGLPGREHELWRRTDFRTLEQALPLLDPQRSSPPTRNLDDLPPALLERIGSETGHIGLVVQRNADVVIEQTPPELSRQGVIVCSLERALVQHADKLRERLGTLIEPDYDGYAAMGAAPSCSGSRPSSAAGW